MLHTLLSEIREFDAVTQLIEELEAQHVTGRPGYPIAAKMAGLLAQYLYGIPTITGLVRALKDNPNLRAACGIDSMQQVPSEDAFYRFRKKLLDNSPLQDATTKVINTLAWMLDNFGRQVAVDGTDIEAWCNTSRKPESDQDAQWGARNFRNTPDGKKVDHYYGYKLHLLVDANHELPVGWRLTAANVSECTQAVPVFGRAKEKYDWFAPQHFIADKGYDDGKIHQALEFEYDCHPVIPIRDMGGEEVLALEKDGRPSCHVATWERTGTDYKHKRNRYSCPVRTKKMVRQGGFTGCGSCPPNGCAEWLKCADDPRKQPMIPRHTPKFTKLYNKRGSVEREFSRLKGQFMLDTIRVQGIDKVSLHVNLAIFVRLLKALANHSPP